MAVNYSQQLGLGAFDPTGRMQRGQRHTQDLAFNQQTMDMRGTQFNQQQEDRLAQQAQQQAQQAKAQEMQELSNQASAFVQSGDLDGLNQIMNTNPELREIWTESAQFMGDEAKQGRVRTAVSILEGTVDPIEAYQKRRSEVLARGGDASGLDKLLESNDPEQMRKTAKIDLMMLDPEIYKNYGETKKPDFQQGTGAMQGFAFNPDNGEYSINPGLQKRLIDASLNPEVDAKTRQAINKDVTALTKDTKLIYNTAKDLESLKDVNSGPAAIAMVFKFMKALDPTSVVREGEFTTAEGSSGVPEKLSNYFNKLLSGERLGPEQINEFITTSKQLANSAIDNSTPEIENYLAVFEDTLPKDFKQLTLDRIPPRFDMPEPSPTNNNNEADSSEGRVATGPNGQKAILINGKWVVQ